MTENPPLSIYPDLGDRVYHLIREQILAGKMPPGSLLLGVELAREIGVSRTPVADALNVLAAEGLVQLVPRKGYFVASFDAQDYLDLMEARLAIELAAVERSKVSPTHVAALQEEIDAMAKCVDEQGHFRDFHEGVRCDMCFHERLVDTAANAYLGELYRRLSARVHLAHVHFSLIAPPRPAADIAREHLALLAAFASGDQGALRAAVVAHVEGSTRFYAAIEPDPPASQPAEVRSANVPAARQFRWLGRHHPAGA